MYMQNSKQTI